MISGCACIIWSISWMSIWLKAGLRPCWENQLSTEPVSRILSKFSQSRTLPIRQVEWAKVFLLCSEGWNNLQISYQVSIHQDAVNKWRNRFFKSLPLLQQVEQTDPENLETQISALLADHPGPGSQQRLPTNRSPKSLKSPA